MEEKLEFIPWDERYSMGIPLIDDQHRRLLDLANALHDTCCEGGDSAREGFRSAAHAVVEYVKEHFTAEEQMMALAEYPEAAAHKAEHKEFIATFLSEVAAFEEGKPFVPQSFLRFLKEWILGHVAQTDKAMGQHFVGKAKKGELGAGRED